MLRITRVLPSIFVKILKNRGGNVLLRTFLCGRHCPFAKPAYFSSLSARYMTFSLENKSLCTSSVRVLSCWKCHHSYPASIQGEIQFFCPSCSVVQQPQEDRTYFDVIGCEQTFDLDTKHLTNTYRKLQSQLHPDKFSLKSETEQTYSSSQSSIVNKAYDTLLKPLSRGLYLLEIHGSSIEEGNIANDVEFLSDIMEMNETLESGSEKTLHKLKNQIQENLQWCIQKASDAFKENNLITVKEILSKMKYYDNIHEQIKEKLMEL